MTNQMNQTLIEHMALWNCPISHKNAKKCRANQNDSDDLFSHAYMQEEAILWSINTRRKISLHMTWS